MAGKGRQRVEREGGGRLLNRCVRRAAFRAKLCALPGVMWGSSQCRLSAG